MSTFTEDQKSDIRALLATPLLQQALQNALSDVLTGTYGESSMEGAAMAYKKAEGAREIISQLYTNVDVKTTAAATHRRFKPEAPIS
jgi:hypothetical protein